MSETILLDGAMGTQLQAAGMKPGEHPEVYAKAHPDVVRAVHERYIEAGSRVIYANTFGANARKLAGTGMTVEQAVEWNVALAKQAVEQAAKNAEAPRIRVALDAGPLGELLEPMGSLRFEEAYDLYRAMFTAGERCGADLIVIETLTDLYEAKAALLAAKESTGLPVWVTMTFEANGRTFLGTSAEAAALTLGSLGADALGVNCSLGPDEIFPILKTMSDWTDKPLIVKPNAGLPDPRTGEYPMGAAEFAEKMKPFRDLGVAAAGGCCGTTPEFIRELAGVFRGAEARPAGNGAKRSGVCSAGSVAEYGRINIIGERINPTGKKRLQQALRDEDMNYLMKLAVEQQEAGAAVLDINVGVPGVDEVRLMEKAVKAVQSVTDLPLQIDSADPAVVEAGLRAVNGRAVINSVNGDKERMDRVFPLAKHYGAAVLGLAMDESGIPETAAQRIEILERITAEAERQGISRKDLILDCLTLTVSAQQEQARETLAALRHVHDEMGMHAALGVSNVSFGLPAKIHVTENFLIQALAFGLDFPIVNPNDKVIADAVASFRALSGEDPACAAYIERFAPEEAAAKAAAKEERKKGGAAPAGGSVSAADASVSSGASAGSAAGLSGAASGASGTGAASGPAGRPVEDPLESAILKGLKQDAADITGRLLSEMAGMDIIQQKIIPALDEVGRRYEAGILYLPQLISSAGAACAGLDLIRGKMLREGGASVSRGKIILATVRGDIHDIGKNIVKVVLQNYGYQIIDLGKDVPPEEIVQAAKEQDVKLVGLSALMTTTVGAMEETIRLLHEACPDCAVFVGGAVLTREYAEEIHADYYSRDAQEAAGIAKKVLG